MFPYAKRYEFYGASELSFVTALVDAESERRPNSVGKPCHNVQVRICNEVGEEVQKGEIGTVYVKSDQFFMGYIIDGVLTRELNAEGWMTVRDIGYEDAELLHKVENIVAVITWYDVPVNIREEYKVFHITEEELYIDWFLQTVRSAK
ncbi:AMP-binding protein [Bacillus sp. HC-Mk]